MYSEDELLPLSALQHVLFCERQFAFIHVEQSWNENRFTVRGDAFHTRAHQGRREVRGTKVVSFGLEISSAILGITGKTDAVEILYTDRAFREIEKVTPVEYKVGRPKKDRYDEVQLCAQAMCLEEMLHVEISEAALYYGKTRHRTRVELNQGLRNLVTQAARRVHEIMASGVTPPPVYEKRKCETCSFFDICRPRTLERRGSAAGFISKQVSHLLSSQD